MVADAAIVKAAAVDGDNLHFQKLENTLAQKSSSFDAVLKVS